MKFSLDGFVKKIDMEELNLCGVSVMQHGQKLDEYRWEGDSPHRMYSLSKSFTSTAVGMAIDEGYFKLTDCVVNLLSEFLPDKVSDNMSKLTVRDLLMMASGHSVPYLLIYQRDNVIGEDWVKYFLRQPFDLKPGTKFVYDTGCTYLLGTIVQKVTGEKLVDFLTPRLFHKFNIERPIWLECPNGRNIAGDGLFLKTNDLLKFGQLFLQRGFWRGEKLISESWIKEATAKQIDSCEAGIDDPQCKPDWFCGYGYQFWMCTTGAYRADGKDCQMCIIDEKRDAVVAITANEDRSQQVLNVVWQEINPLLDEAY